MLEEFLPSGWRRISQNIISYEHSKTVANAAKRIATCIKEMDSEKAYIYGMMHDVGKFYLDKQNSYKHPRLGYDIMKNSYNDVAKICISHAFPDFDSFEHVLHYCHGDEIETHTVFDILKTIRRNNYIDLIQFCDKISGVHGYMTIEDKFNWYIKMYKIEKNAMSLHYLKCLNAIKKNLDKIAGSDVYDIVDIKNTRV
jgi:hypothetical protein